MARALRFATTAGVLFLLFASAAPLGARQQAQWPGDPYVVSWTLQGVLPCTGRWDPWIPKDLCLVTTRFASGPPPPHTGTLPIDVGLSSLVVALDSDPDLLGQAPWLHLDWHEPTAFQDLRGQAQLHGRSDFTAADPFTQQGHEVPFDILRDSDAPQPQVALETAYRFCITWYYNGASVPNEPAPCA